MSFLPVTHTKISNYNNCPHKAYRLYVAKDIPYTGPSSKQGHDGIDIHKQIENYMRHKGSLDPKLAKHVDPLIALGASPEVQIGLAEDRTPTNYWGDDVFMRVVVDAFVVRDDVAFIVDWKTGNPKYEDKRELAMQAVGIQACYPGVKKIIGSYLWIRDDKLGQEYDLSSTDRAWHGTVSKAQEMEADKIWIKKPNPLCAYCPVKDCEHNRS